MTEHNEPSPNLDAWKRTTASGETRKVIVGKFWNGPQRIEIDPDDLITDPDAIQSCGDGIPPCEEIGCPEKATQRVSHDLGGKSVVCDDHATPFMAEMREPIETQGET